MIKKVEYQAAGVPRHWNVGADKANTVEFNLLGEHGFAPERDAIALSWLLAAAVPDLD
ncbi:MAG TPA: hypothetical protein VF163_23025 [Micromonosporaceae bacterium]